MILSIMVILVKSIYQRQMSQHFIEPQNFKQEKKSAEILMGKFFIKLYWNLISQWIFLLESSTRTTKKFKDYLIENELEMYDVMLEKERDLI